MLLLKLTLIPLAVLALGITERLHGPRVAGWLSGFPVVAFPLLLFVTLDHGGDFGSASALGAWYGLVAWLSFAMTYSWCSRRLNWFWCIAVSFAVWTAMAVIMLEAQRLSVWTELLPVLAFIVALASYPRGEASDEQREHVWWGLPARMLAGAVLTVVVTQFSEALGSRWSGMFSTFPMLGSVIAVSNHIQYGPRAVQEAVAGMSMGIASIGTFCFALYMLLPVTGIWTAFGLALAASSTAHALTYLLFKNKTKKS
ncbi:MAG: hypothetical protein V4601_00500 [Pseudomonadota bacterium]